MKGDGGRTLLQALQASLEATGRDSADRVPPAAVLWTDAEGQWLSVMPVLRAVMPALYTLGEYDPGKEPGRPSGCGAWLIARCRTRLRRKARRRYSICRA